MRTESSFEGTPNGGGVPPGSVLRVPPTVQFITHTDPLIQQQIRVYVEQNHRKGLRLERICELVGYYARSIGFEAAIKAYSVQCGDLLHGAEQAVRAALILVHLQPIEAPNGYHLSWFRIGGAAGAAESSPRDQELQPTG